MFSLSAKLNSARLGNSEILTSTPEMFVFAGGESQVKLSPDFMTFANNMSSVTISALLQTADGVMQLLLLTDAVRRAVPAGTPVHLAMPYVPYARQDRVCNAGEALSAKVFCDLINAQGYASVTITDPHSDVVAALLDRVAVIDAADRVAEVLRAPEFKDGVMLIAPDAGARKRVMAIAKKVGVSIVGFADKVRDTRTGEISGTTFPSVPDDLPALVVDDILDGGRTFLELAKAGKAAGFRNKLYLYITHGIFSRGLNGLDEGFDKIFAAYAWAPQDPEKVVVLSS